MREFKNTTAEEIDNYRTFCSSEEDKALRCKVMEIRTMVKTYFCMGVFAGDNTESSINRALTELGQRAIKATKHVYRYPSVEELREWREILSRSKSEKCQRCQLWIDYSINGLCDDCRKILKSV